MTPTIARPASTAARHTVKTKTWQGYSEVYWHASSNNTHHVKHPEGNSKHADLTPLSQYDSTQCNSYVTHSTLLSLTPFQLHSTELNSTQLDSTQLKSAQFNSTSTLRNSSRGNSIHFIRLHVPQFSAIQLNSPQFNSLRLFTT